MVALEAYALEKLNGITSHRANLIISKSLKAATIPSDSIALISDIEFS